MSENDEKIESKFEKAFVQISGANPIFPYLAKQQMGKMIEEIVRTNDILSPNGPILGTKQSTPIKGGYAAEEFHAHTFNMDAILNDSDAKALTDRHPGWYQYELDGQTLVKNANADIIIVENGNVVSSTQVKYNKNAHDTAGEMSQISDGKVKYGNRDTYIGPSDQTDDIKLQTEANIQKNLERNGDPVQRDAFQQTQDKVTGTLTDGKISSTELSKEEANSLGKGDTSKLNKVNNDYQTRSTIKQMKNAAIGAAAMSAIVSGTVNSLSCILRANRGEITPEEAVKIIVTETICSAADSAVKASANTGLQSLMVRYGTEKAVLQTFAKQGLKSMLKTNVVTVGVVCGIDAVKDLVKLGMGKITKEEFYERQGKNLATTSAGVMGGSLGALASGTVAASFAISGAAAATLTILGSLCGGLISGLAMNLAIDNTIENPYKDLVSDTKYMLESAKELERASQTVLIGQILFSKFIDDSRFVDKQIDNIFDKIDKSGRDALENIKKI